MGETCYNAGARIKLNEKTKFFDTVSIEIDGNRNRYKLLSHTHRYF